MSTLEVLLLGPPRILCNQKQVAVKRRKALALLAYLAVSQRRHSREALATLLWPEAETTHALARLRHIIWILKQNGISGWLKTDHDHVELPRDSRLWVDVVEFRQRLAACRAPGTRGSGVRDDGVQALAEALNLYRDHFMTGFGLRDSETFDEWQLQQDERLRALLAEALEKLIRAHEGEGRFAESIAYARRWLALNPLCEPAQRRLMSLYAACGRRSEALDLYDHCERLLKNELGLSVAQETLEIRNRIVAEKLEAETESQATTSTPRGPKHNLPPQSTPFIGRASELDLVQRHLGDAGCRLLALVGPGGCGKTRLALKVAGAQLEAFPDGVFFIPLAAVSAPESVVPAILDVLSVPVSHRQPEKREQAQGRSDGQHARLMAFLRRRQMLLLLDNMEHLPESATLVADILGAAPDVKILATSREPLRLSSERVIKLAGLPYPPPAEKTQRWDEYGSIQLFLQCARRRDPEFHPTHDDMLSVTWICRLLEGGPLGIELASEWVRMMSLREIAVEIESGLDFLTTSRPDVPERHRSLRAAFEHSWNLLSDEERSCFRKLAVFRGGFAREAAREVAGCSLETLSSLLDKSLLRQDTARHFEVHEVVRQFAEEKLRADPKEFAGVRNHLGMYYLDKLAQMESSLKGSGQRGALKDLARDGENIRTAWTWAAEHGWVEKMRAAVQSLFLFYDIRSRFQQGAQTFGDAFEILKNRHVEAHEEGARLALLGSLSACHGWFVRFDTPAESLDLLRRGVEHLESHGPGRELAFARVLAGIVGPWQSEDIVRHQIEECVTMYEAAHDHWGTALALEMLGFVLESEHPARALRCAQRSLRLRQQLGDQWGVALALFAMAWIAERRGMPHAAKKRYRESLKLRRQLGEDLDGIIDCLNNMGRVARRTGNFDEALRLFGECLDYAQEIDNRLRAAHSLTQLGTVAYDLGECALARSYLEEALSSAEILGDGWCVTILPSLLANVALATDDTDEARFLLHHETPYCGPEPPRPHLDPSGSGFRHRSDNTWRELGLGRLAALDGDEIAARKHYARALRLSKVEQNDPTTLEILIEIASLWSGAGKPDPAAELLGLVLNHPALSAPRRIRAEQLLKNAAKILPAHTLKSSLARGKACDLADVIATMVQDTGEIE